MNEELIKWLDYNHIKYKVLESDVIEVEEFGKMYYEDTSKIKSIFRTDADGNVKFNSIESTSVLKEEGIFYVVFKFGNNWYYQDIRENFDFHILKYIGKRKETKLKNEYVNLGIHTPYELLNGSFSVKDWVKKAKYLGHSAIGVCDYNTMASAFILQNECKAAGIQYVFGYSLTFVDNGKDVGAKIYVQTQQGLQNLLRIQKCINVDSSDKKIYLKDLEKYGSGNVIVFDKYSSRYIAERGNDICDELDYFDDIYYQLDLSEFKAERIDVTVLESTKYYFDNVYAKGIEIAPVLINDCYYLDKEDAKNKIILNKIACGASHEQSDDQYFKDIDEIWNEIEPLFSDKYDIKKIFDESCQNTIVIASYSEAEFDTSRNFMPQYDMTEEEASKYANRHIMFLELLEDGFEKLVPKGKEEEYRKRLDYEIYVLEETNNVDYMLVQYDTVNWARKNGIFVGCGRGSAGGCLVLYLLGITLVDPIKYNLIFERFLLPERAGLFQSKATIIGDDIDSKEYVKMTLANGKTYNIDKDAQLLVKRNGNDDAVVIYADEIQENDDIQFDNRDVAFTLEEV